MAFKLATVPSEEIAVSWIEVDTIAGMDSSI
jgi:hypothetical protein